MTHTLGKLYMLTFGCLLLARGATLFDSAQPTANMPPSPVVLTENTEGLTVQNISDRQIVQLSLGCFFTRGRMKFAHHWFSSQQVSLLPQMHLQVADQQERQEMLERCKSYFPKYRPSIIVVHVIFVDEKEWPPPPSIPGGWAENLKGTPLTLSTTRTGYIVLNNSEQAITDYTLGCVQIKRDHVKILRRYPSSDLRKALEPGGSMHSFAIDAPAPDIVQDCVLHRKKKMAVVDVTFEDGTRWQTPPKPWKH